MKKEGGRTAEPSLVEERRARRGAERRRATDLRADGDHLEKLDLLRRETGSTIRDTSRHVWLGARAAELEGRTQSQAAESLGISISGRSLGSSGGERSSRKCFSIAVTWSSIEGVASSDTSRETGNSCSCTSCGDSMDTDMHPSVRSALRARKQPRSVSWRADTESKTFAFLGPKARGEAGPESDVDLADSHSLPVGGFESSMDFCDEVERALHRRVDVVVEDGLSPADSAESSARSHSPVKDDRVYLGHILEAVERILTYSDVGETTFRDELKTQDAIIRNLQVMGEAVKKVSTDDASRASGDSVEGRCRNAGSSRPRLLRRIARYRVGCGQEPRPTASRKAPAVLSRIEDVDSTRVRTQSRMSRLLGGRRRCTSALGAPAPARSGPPSGCRPRRRHRCPSRRW